MSLSDFKIIFWPEYIHRLLGRTIGVVFLIPLIIFATRRRISKRFFWRLVFIFALGGLQGIIGWLMVKSGLVNNPHVNPLRLALHLSTALLIYALLMWAAMDVAVGHRQRAIVEESTIAYGLGPIALYLFWFFLLCLQIFFGALMAGTHAGLMYNTWPDMNGEFIPNGVLMPPWYDNITLIQLIHRNLAVLAAFGFVFWWHYYRNYVKSTGLGKLCRGAALIIAVQFALGVVTLLHQAPLPLAWAHQAMALVLFTLTVLILWHAKRERRILENGKDPALRLRRPQD